VFVKNCAACHGDHGQGLIGPNLTDDNWLHGQGVPADIVKTISEGVAEKGMPPWGPVLKPEEIVGATAYIRSLHGSNPAGAKEPQGPVYEFKEL
jgi:cytochrome c oxidase cbb3-type subunit 3